MDFGLKVPDGYLPAFSVDTEQEAKLLLAGCCPMGYDGHYYARELVDHQTLENLQRFSDRLAHVYAVMQQRKKKVKK